MSEFWDNILRYPRFFFSSVSGLILVILTPFINVIRTTKSRVILLLVTVLIIIFFYLVLKSMAGI
jgi:hypothetical protein